MAVMECNLSSTIANYFDYKALFVHNEQNTMGF